jgi:FkbM family methyltransferase
MWALRAGPFEETRLRLLRALFLRGWYRNSRSRARTRRFWPRTRVRVDGFVYDLYPGDNATDHLMFVHGHHPEARSVAVLVRLVEGRRCLILDIGANSGTYTVPLARACAPGSSLVAFEPIPPMRRRLERNLALNGLAAGVTVVEAALGGEAGSAELNLHPENFGQSSLRALDVGDARVRVEVRPLADFVADPGAFDLFLIKIDVEGLEDTVLGPYLDAAPDDALPHAILIEMVLAAEWKRDLAELLHARGYRIVFEAEENALFVRGLPEALVQSAVSSEPASSRR